MQRICLNIFLYMSLSLGLTPGLRAATAPGKAISSTTSKPAQTNIPKLPTVKPVKSLKDAKNSGSAAKSSINPAPALQNTKAQGPKLKSAQAKKVSQAAVGSKKAVGKPSATPTKGKIAATQKQMKKSAQPAPMTLKAKAPKATQAAKTATKAATKQLKSKEGAQQSAPQNALKAKKSPGNQQKAKKVPPQPDSNAAGQEKTPPPPTPEMESADEEGSWIPLIMGGFTVVLGSFGLYLYRKRKKETGSDPSTDLSSDEAPLSTFVSNVTAVELDARSHMESALQGKGKGRGQNGKKDRPPISNQPPVTAADHRTMQDTPQASSMEHQRLGSAPPPSGAPSQIVVPKKGKNPAA